jgi:hypothetical protein
MRKLGLVAGWRSRTLRRGVVLDATLVLGGGGYEAFTARRIRNADNFLLRCVHLKRQKKGVKESDESGNQNVCFVTGFGYLLGEISNFDAILTRSASDAACIFCITCAR